MIGVTLFGLFLTPVFYVVLMKLGFRKRPAGRSTGPAHGLAGAGAGASAVAGIAGIALLLAVAPAQAGWLKVGPDYHRPTNSIPAAYKAAEMGQWKEGRPLDNVPKGTWWELFADRTLNDLEARALSANQQLKEAIARVEQARATARVARGELLPTLSADPSFTRQRYSPNQNPSFGRSEERRV